MEDLYLCLKIPATLIFTIMEKLLMVKGEGDIGPTPATLIPIIRVRNVYCWVYLLLLVLFTKVFMGMKEVIVVVMMEAVDLDLKIPATLTFTIVEKMFIVMGEVNIGIRPANIPPMIQMGLVYHWFSLFMFMRVAEIGI